MTELKWKTPPPPVPIFGKELDIDWAERLIQWLRDQERNRDIDVESIVSVGGLGVAERLIGFEKIFSGYTPTETLEILDAPAAGKRRVIVGFSFHAEDLLAIGTIHKTIGATEYIITSFDTTAPPGNNQKDPPIVSVKGLVTLDDITETIEITITSGTSDIHVTGSYLEVD